MSTHIILVPDKKRKFPENIHKCLLSWTIKRITYGLKSELELATLRLYC